MKIKSVELRLRFILFLNSNDHHYTEEEVSFLLDDIFKDSQDYNMGL